MRLSELIFEELIPEIININGQKQFTRNSLGDYIGNSIETIQNFYKWFGNSKVVDEQFLRRIYQYIVEKNIITESNTETPKEWLGRYNETLL